MKPDKLQKAVAYRQAILAGISLLHERFHYSQRVLTDKLAMVNCTVSTPTMTNIINYKSVGLTMLAAVASGIREIIRLELGMEYDDESGNFIVKKASTWKPETVPEKSRGMNGIRIHYYGRLPAEQKASFIVDAQAEVIEAGVRLSSFTRYFISENENTYKSHIVDLLKKGVHFKGYLLDPESNEARIYFEDRATVFPEERDSIGEIKRVMEKLQRLTKEFKDMDLPGQFEIFTYKHIPYCLFYTVDGGLETGKMMVSPYLYGIRRANCPVWEISKKEQPGMFRVYWDSLHYLTKTAKILQ